MSTVFVKYLFPIFLVGFPLQSDSSKKKDSASDLPDDQISSPEQLAQKVVQKLNDLQNLSFDVKVNRYVDHGNGKVVSFEKWDLAVYMGTRGRFHFHGKADDDLELQVSSDGRIMEEWNSVTRKILTQTLPADPFEGRSTLADDVLGARCGFGSYLNNWLGDSDKARWLKTKFSAGKYLGLKDINGTLQHVVIHQESYWSLDEDKEGTLVQQEFHIDPKTYYHTVEYRSDRFEF